jgi:predicted flap endonuclease-1-like 5' DNA nuclease
VPPPANGNGHPGLRPAGLPQPRGLIADDLKRIRGIGLQSELRLQSLGIWHFDQIADWTPDNARWVGSFLAFRGRIERENWIEQAKALAGAPPLLEGAAKAKRARPPSKKAEPEPGPPT